MTILTLDDGLDLNAVRALFREYAQGLGVPLDFQGFEAELTDLPGKYAPPTGQLWLALDPHPVGTVAVRPHAPGVCEMKRLYVRPETRGTGLGRSLALRSMAWSKEAGYEAMLLDTLARLEPAVCLYESLGFTETTPYNVNPEPDIRYYRRVLT